MKTVLTQKVIKQSLLSFCSASLPSQMESSNLKPYLRFTLINILYHRLSMKTMTVQLV